MATSASPRARRGRRPVAATRTATARPNSRATGGEAGGAARRLVATASTFGAASRAATAAVGWAWATTGAPSAGRTRGRGRARIGRRTPHTLYAFEIRHNRQV